MRTGMLVLLGRGAERTDAVSLEDVNCHAGVVLVLV